MIDSLDYNKFFCSVAKDKIGSYLEQNEFKLTDELVEANGCELTYTKNKQDVIIYSDTHLMDYPYFFNILFKYNDGQPSNPEYRKVPLWYMKTLRNPGKKYSEYNLADNRTMGLIKTERLNYIFDAVLKELKKNDAGFLSGEIEQFKSIRDERFELSKSR